MTDSPHAELLPAHPFTVDFVKTSSQPTTYVGTCVCEHGTCQTTTYLYDTRTVDPVGMVNSAIRHHALMMGCTCTYTPSGSSLDADVTLGGATGTPAGQQRIIPQTAATLNGPNFFYGPPLSGVKMGAYVVSGTVKLATGVRQGATGRGGILISGRPALQVALADIGGFATATFGGVVRISPNESVVVTYDNTSSSAQDVTAATLNLAAAFVP